jgi:ubiquinone/menaquinone biosynthesis C-methylase UbiE
MDAPGNTAQQNQETDEVTTWTGQEVASGYSAIDGSTDRLLGYPFVFRSLGLADGHHHGGTLLDFGSGPGRVADEAARRFGLTVLAADISQAMLETSQQRGNRMLRHHLIVDDTVEELPDGCADLAMCNFVLVCVRQRERLLRMFAEVHRLLRPGGRFTVLNPDHSRVGVRFDCFRLGAPGTVYEAGDPLHVRLKRTDGTWLEIVDTYWPGEVYGELLAEAGFRDIARTAPLLDDALGARLITEETFRDTGKWTAERTMAPFVLFTGTR